MASTCSRISAVSALVLLALTISANAHAWTLEEPPAEAGNWGYRPADGSTPDVNPPAFSWSPEKNARGWDIQVASEADFKRVVAENSTEWTAATLAKELAPGDYHWRYRATNSDGEHSTWSRSRAFIVDAEAPAFPRLPLDDLVERIPDEHPRLFVRPEQRDELRAIAEEQFPEAWAAILADAESLLSKEIDTSEPPLYPEGTVRKSKEWRNIWWGNRRRAIAASEPAARLAFAYWMTGDERFGNRARELTMAVMAWDPKGSTQYNYNDEAAMPLLYWPTRAYTWAHDRFSEEDRKLVTEVMRVRARDCYWHLRKRKHLWNPYASHSNRAWHWLLEVAVAFKDTISEAPEWLDYSTTLFYSCYPVWGGPDGAWHEGIAYWSSYLSRFQYGAMAMEQALGINAFDKPFFSANGYYAMYTLPPGTETGGWADQSNTFTSARCASLMAMLAAGAGNSHWQWYAEQHDIELAKSGWFGLLFAARRAGGEAHAPEELPSSRAFTDTGLAVMNSNLLDGSDNIQVQFKSSPYGTQSHGYNANNAFLLNIDGQRGFIRTGKRDVYGSPHHTQWMWSTRSDNAILVNGEGQMKHSPKAQGRITHFETSATKDVVVGEAGDSYENLDRWTRTITFLKPDVIVIHDVLEAPQPSTFQWLLHAQAEFEIEENAATVDTPPGPVAIEFLYPPELVTTQSNEFDPPPHDWSNIKLDEWHLTASTTAQSATEEFVTLLRVKGAEADIEVDMTTRRITGNYGSREVELLLDK